MSGFENLKAVVGQNFYNHRPQQFIIFCDDNPRCVIRREGRRSFLLKDGKVKRFPLACSNVNRGSAGVELTAILPP